MYRLYMYFLIRLYIINIVIMYNLANKYSFARLKRYPLRPRKNSWLYLYFDYRYLINDIERYMIWALRFKFRFKLKLKHRGE